MIKQIGFTLVEGLLIVLILSVVGFAGYTVWSQGQDDEVNITNYQQCVDAGNPIMESNPPQCSAEGQTFTGDALRTESESFAESETLKISNVKFSVEIPNDWNYRACMDHDGFGALVAGGDGEMRCIWSDATWLDTDMASRSRVSVGYSSNPFPRQDWSSGQQKDIYETDASELELSDGRIAKKYTYMAEEQNNKGVTFDVTEYTLDGVSVFVFDGHSVENQLLSNGLTTVEIMSLVESTLLPSIKLL